MRTQTFKKVLVTALATVMMATSISPATVEASSKKDKTKPTVQVKVANKGKYVALKNKSAYNKILRIKVSDKSGIKKVQVKYTYSGTNKTQTYKKNIFTLKKEGDYRISVVDKKGNKKTLTVVIDKTKPNVSLKTFTKGKWKGAVSICFSDCGTEGTSGIDYIVLDGEKKIINDKSGYIGVAESGRHKIEIFDKAGNKTTKTFTIK